MSSDQLPPLFELNEINTLHISILFSFKGSQTLTSHFFRYTLLVFFVFFYSCLNYLWHTLNGVLKTFLKDFGPY